MSGDLSARIDLLDAQLLDCDRLPIGRVDDVELDVSGGQAEVVALLTGSEALGDRLGGSLGRAMARVSRRLRRPEAVPGPRRIDPSLVAETEPMIQLSVGFGELPEIAPLERWLSDHIISKLPGAGDASE